MSNQKTINIENLKEEDLIRIKEMLRPKRQKAENTFDDFILAKPSLAPVDAEEKREAFSSRRPPLFIPADIPVIKPLAVKKALSLKNKMKNN
mmetsp:Transcript_35383/g.31850  ORF Transcript_35383/g.31850 Transcript_35383/m.31850 type:complete len:92 (-) Transcript_35383:54-329(-)